MAVPGLATRYLFFNRIELQVTNILFITMLMAFELLSKIDTISIIANGSSIRELPRLQKIYGFGRWLKLKGIAKIKLSDGFITNAELHWY